MRRILLGLLALAFAGGAVAQPAAPQYPTPTFRKVILTEGGSSGSISGMSVKPTLGLVERLMSARANDIIMLSDYCLPNVPDATSCTQTALNVAKALGGAEVVVPAALGNPTYLGTLGLFGSGVALSCSSLEQSLVFKGGTGDAIQVGFQSGQIARTRLSRCRVDTTNRTGGVAINLKGAVQSDIENVTLEHPFNGLLIDNFNGITLRNVTATSVRGAYGIKATGTTALRSDVLTAYNISVNCGYSPGTDGFVIDGFVHTIRTHGGNVISCNRNLWVTNTSSDAAAYPQFLYINNLESDGATLGAAVVDVVAGLHVAIPDWSNNSGGGGQGNNDGPAFVLNPGLNGVTTQQVTITGGRIGNTQREAALINGTDVTVTGTVFTDASKAGAGASPTVRVAGSANKVTLTANRIGAQPGGAVRASYGIVIDGNATKVVAANNNVAGNLQAVFVGSTDLGSYAINNVVDNSGTLSTFGRFTSSLMMGVTNFASGANAAAGFSLTTGTPNSYSLIKLNDRNGSPTLDTTSGPAVTSYSFDRVMSMPGATMYNLVDAASDSAAAAAGVPVAGIYRTGNAVKVRTQ